MTIVREAKQIITLDFSLAYSGVIVYLSELLRHSDARHLDYTVCLSLYISI